MGDRGGCKLQTLAPKEFQIQSSKILGQTLRRGDRIVTWIFESVWSLDAARRCHRNSGTGLRSAALRPALSRNRKVGQASRLPPSATPAERNRSRWRARWAGGTPALRWAGSGSWPQCMRRSQKRLSMNLVNQGRLSGWLSRADASHSPKFSICTLAVEAGFSKD